MIVLRKLLCTKGRSASLSEEGVLFFLLVSREYSFLHVNAPKETIVDRGFIVFGSSFDGVNIESSIW